MFDNVKNSEKYVFPTVSIITVCYNSEKTIQSTINSVLNQTYPNIEYIIVDGGSTDNTIEIIKNNSKFITKWISEPDNGIYDAMNKGIKMSEGKLIATLNADDCYVHKDIVSEVVKEYLKDNKIDILHGDVSFCDNEGKELFSINGEKYPQDNLYKELTIWQPTMFVNKTAYENYGLYNTNFKIAGDYEFIFRVINKCKIKYVGFKVTNMSLGGVSNSKYISSSLENFKIRKKYKINVIINTILTLKTIIFPYFRIILEKIGFTIVVKMYRRKLYKERRNYY